MSGILLKFLPKNELLHQSLYFCRGMAKKKSQSQGTEKGKKTCNKNQFFGGCFKSEITHLLKWFHFLKWMVFFFQSPNHLGGRTRRRRANAVGILAKMDPVAPRNRMNS